jgi:hypothetical protein
MLVQAGEPDREICRRVASDLPSAGRLGRPGRPCGRLTGTRPCRYLCNPKSVQMTLSVLHMYLSFLP